MLRKTIDVFSPAAACMSLDSAFGVLQWGEFPGQYNIDVSVSSIFSNRDLLASYGEQPRAMIIFCFISNALEPVSLIPERKLIHAWHQNCHLTTHVF